MIEPEQKYTFRIWNGRMKEHDIEKIVHYSEMAWTMSNGQIIKKDDAVQFKPRIVKQKAVGEV